MGFGQTYILKDALSVERINAKGRIVNGKVPTYSNPETIPPGETIIRSGQTNNDGMVRVEWQSVSYLAWQSDIDSKCAALD